MKTWYVVFEDSPHQEVIVDEAESELNILQQFDDAAKNDTYEGRKVKGMWVIDRATEQMDVLRVYGHASPQIHARHRAWKGPLDAS